MFDSGAERLCWEQSTAEPPTLDELEFLDQDLKKWVPNFPDLFKGKKVLDLGAGRGMLGGLVAERYAPCLAVSLDLGLHRLRAASGWVGKLQNFAAICGDAFTLPFRDQTFDYVVGNSLLHHFPELDRATAEIARVLRSGGFYIGREPNFDNPIVRAHVFKLDGTWLRRHAKVSANEYPLRAKAIRDSFRRAECSCNLHYFWRRFRHLHHPILSVAISVRAQRTR
jgi:ubiquinone/menaquinone biosynthesis C-methylase UbiE